MDPEDIFQQKFDADVEDEDVGGGLQHWVTFNEPREENRCKAHRHNTQEHSGHHNP